MKNILKNQKGFETLTIVGLILILGLVGGIGWYVWDNRNTASDSDSNVLVKSYEEKNNEKVSSAENLFKFEEFDVSMNILPGWTVEKAKEEDFDGNKRFVSYSIRKQNTTTAIKLSERDFRGGFYDCGPTTETTLTKVNISDSLKTKNKNLHFTKYSYDSSGDTYSFAGIILANSKEFYATSDISSKITNNQVKKGTYFYCNALPRPGFNLDLGREGGHDDIKVVNINEEDASNPDFDSASYEEVKKMLTSIQ